MCLESDNIKRLISEKAFKLGFSDIGFTSLSEFSKERQPFQLWLKQGHHANMKYMERNLDKRLNPSLLVDNATTAIVVVKNYYNDSPLVKSAPKISRYASGIDYHLTIKRDLKTLFDYIKADIYPALEGRYFTDTPPLLERSIAERAGLGYIGKNSLLITPKFGSWVFIGEMLVNLPLPADKREVPDRCGSCTRCIDACPSKAILPGRTIDSRRCISWLTIENRDKDLPGNLRESFNGWIFGCDICQEVCPWNIKNATPVDNSELVVKDEVKEVSLPEWEELSTDSFSKLFKNSAVKRTKYSGLKRNINFVLSKK
ncbi:tRNA epoxyqueuosine(34) reductase QueG [Marinilabiliaceae bacterium ANBcel2]|nr:tRNA epoxyqueuosine(34) reductase QueG [Marinilabiliaceae bacterium ANBcel2]